MPRNRQRRMLAEVAAALDAGRSVAVDNTNPSRADRAPVIELAHARGARVVAYHVRATTREAVARNEGTHRPGTGAEGGHLHRRETASSHRRWQKASMQSATSYQVGGSRVRGPRGHADGDGA